MPAPRIAADPTPPSVDDLHPVVAVALLEIERRATGALPLVGRDHGAVREAAAAITARAAAAAEDVRRLVEAMPAAGEDGAALADEVHDALGHGLSLAAVLAGVARTFAAADPGRTRTALAEAAAAAGAAAAELDSLLAASAASRPGAGAAAPGLTTGPAGDREPAAPELALLLAQQRAAGRPLRVEVDDGALAAAGPRVAGSARRIVRESLTNVRKHSPGAAVGVRVGAEEGHLLVLVASDGAGGGEPGGRGLAAMRRRARAVGGHLDAGHAPGGGFRVQARLPLAASN
jgi:signal transduction histidine kinase